MSSEVFNFTIDTPYEESIGYQTLISESESGKEQRYQKWIKPRRNFRIKLSARQPVETNQIWRFYTRHKGSFDSFLFENQNENPVTAETIGSGDGIKSSFYFGGSVDIGTGDCVIVPNSETLVRSIGGTGDYLPYSTYTLNDDNGRITTSPALPSGDVLKASRYEFYYRVRFKEDSLSREAFAADLWNIGVELIEIV